MTRGLACSVLGAFGMVLLLGAGWGDDWETIRAAAANVHAVRADFVQEKHLPILTHPLRSEGTFAYRRPDAIRWEYRSPVESILQLKGPDVRRYLRQDGGWVPETGGQTEAMRMVLDEIAGWLGGSFDRSDNYAAELKPGTPTTVELVPRDEQVRRFVTRVVITLAETPGVFQSIEIFEGDDAWTKIEFRDVELNPELADELFTAPP